MQEKDTKQEKIGSPVKRLTSPTTTSTATTTTNTSISNNTSPKESHKNLNGKYLIALNKRIRKNCSAHSTPDGRIFYQNHETKTSSWLPPIESWNSDDHCLPYGWETAIDKDGKNYFINHINKTTTYEDPRKDSDEEPPPLPREVELIRDSQLGFGFVAGSEKPVIVRFVKEGGPSEHHLQAGDQILKINGEDVVKAPREHVIELVKSCKHSITLTVCQPHSNNSTRKSALLTAAKKAKLKSNPSRVRFAEGVVINGSPLFCPLSTFESCVPFMPNVLKVFLENGQTKTFKYDSSTTIQDVMNSLLEKLSIKCGEHFSLVCEHIKAMRRNRLTLLDPTDTIAKIAARPGAHNLRCLFRVMFVPRDAYDLLERDPISFEYLYNQCCNDVVQERFFPELKYEIALRLSALHLHQHSMNSNVMQTTNGKVNLKLIERECGLESFVPFSLLETMKRKELHKLLNHFLKLNQQLCPIGQKSLTAIQAKLHYLKMISELPSYGAKLFNSNIKDSTVESGLLVSPKFGISHVNTMRNSLPISLAKIEDICYIKVTKDDELCYCIEVQIKSSIEKMNPSMDSPLHFVLEDREAEEFVLILKGYHRLFNKYEINSNDRELPVIWDISEEWWNDSAPSYCGLHTVQEAQWNYVPNDTNQLRRIDLAVAPPRYMPCDITRSDDTREPQLYSIMDSSLATVDHNMNEKISCDGIDLPSLVSMEILESQVCDTNIKSEDIIKRVTEMNKIVADAEHYLAEEDNTEVKQVVDKEENAWDETEKLKATDSLLLLTQINGNAADISANDKQNVSDVINIESSPAESDTDSILSPNESPLRRISGPNGIAAFNGLQLTNGCSVNGSRSVKRTGSSFGLHSPDVYPNLIQAEHDLIESLKQLRSEGELKLKFSDDICLDSDLIDLTVIPPPDTPEEEFMGTTIIFPNTSDPPTPYREDIDFLRFSNDDSARVVAELDTLCDTLSEMKAIQCSSTDRNLHLNQQLSHLPQDIDDFIASMTMPPPPTTDRNAVTIANNEEYLSSFIIPPPPSASPTLTKTQDDVIARFWKVTDDIKKMCNNDEISPRLFKREVHSSSSGESGYESVFNSSSFSTNNNDWPVFPEGSPKLSTVIEVVSSESEHSINKQIKSYNKKSDKMNSSESNSCEDLHIIKEMSHQMNGSNTATIKRSPNLSRSHSWNNLPTNSAPTTPPLVSKFQKPPIPPCSPSIQERRRQLAMKSNGRVSPKNQSRNGNHMNVQQHNGYHPMMQNMITSPMMNGINGCLASELVRNETDEIFIQSQRDIDILLARLEDVHENRLSSGQAIKCRDNENFMAAKEALVTESRHFVTASKLFVKCATEASPQLLQYLLECVTLLDRMYSVGEIVIMQMESQAQITCLVDRLKEVAATYAYTVDTVHKLSDTVCSPSTSPYMGLLMNHATSLATSLSALMRTLRAMNM